MQPNEGAIKKLRELRNEGHQIILTTLRKPGRNDPPELTIELTEQALKEQEIPYDHIVHSCSSPRVVINDEGSFAINHPCNTAWQESYFRLTPARRDPSVAKKIQLSLETIAWTNARFAEITNTPEDCDDYVQTLNIAKSLITSGGYNQKDVIKKLTSRPGYTLNGWTVPPAGRYTHDQSQCSKLFRSGEHSYFAIDGMTDGAAMRIAPLAAWYGDNLENLVTAVNKCSRITHAALEARLAAILVALRIRQLLFRTEKNSIYNLLKEFEEAKEILGANKGKTTNFFSRRLYEAAIIGETKQDKDQCIHSLAKNIGITQLAWTTPITAVIWSFNSQINPKDSFTKQQCNDLYNVLTPTRDGSKSSIYITDKTYQSERIEEDLAHVRAADPHNSYLKKRGEKLYELDLDTLLSITFSLLAMKDGQRQTPPKEELRNASNLFGDNLELISQLIACRQGVYH